MRPALLPLPLDFVGFAPTPTAAAPVDVADAVPDEDEPEEEEPEDVMVVVVVSSLETDVYVEGLTAASVLKVACQFDSQLYMCRGFGSPLVL